MDLKEKLKEIPDSPGVYLFKDGKNRVIYVGKAASLRKRVASYFSGRETNPRGRALMAAARDLEWMVLGTEAEALLYEAGLIKRFQPRYNAALKDDKSYPRLRVTAEEFPRVLVTRSREEDGSKYFGPYTDVRLLRQALKIIRRTFPFRTCRIMPATACLDHHLGLCPAPCAGKVDAEEYGEIIRELCLFVGGRREELLRRLAGKMKTFSEQQRFEEAGRVRDQMEALNVLIRRPRRHRPEEQLDQARELLRLPRRPERIEAFDVSHLSGAEAVGSVVRFAHGRPDKAGYRRFRIRGGPGQDDYAMTREIVRRRYEGETDPPDLVVIDGGKGHLRAAREELERLGLGGVGILGLAKEFEHVFLPDQAGPVVLPPDAAVLQLLQRVRDEAHRFARAYHHRLRRRLVSQSELDRIPGVGEKRKRALLRAFGGVAAIRKAGEEELRKAEGINRKVARSIREHFRTR